VKRHSTATASDAAFRRIYLNPGTGVGLFYTTDRRPGEPALNWP
jgi:hypothetical protein